MLTPSPSTPRIASSQAFSVLALGFALVLAACTKPEAEPEAVRAVRTMQVGLSDAGGLHEYAGEVKARVESRLAFRVGGKLVRRQADLGDAVRPGQVLAQLDPQDLKLGQDNARAALASVQAQHDLAAADFKRFQELLAQGFISPAELERREATLKAARAGLDQARAQAAVQGNQAGYAVLVADVGGVVTGIEAERGQVVAAGATVLRVAQDGPRDVVFAVPEDQHEAVRQLEGRADAVKVRIWGDSKTVPATVREVAAAADPSTRTFQVKADIGRATAALGQTATALIEAARVAGVVKLPLSAVFEAGGKSVVWLLDGNTMKLVAQPVEIAGAQGNEVVIAGGLKAGAEVVTAGVHVLSAGQTVRRYTVAAAPTNAKR